MKSELILQWQFGQPELIGQYFVAVKYGDGAGEFQFAAWSGEHWELQTPGEVEAFMDVRALKNQLSIQWPVKPNSTATGDDLWEEV